MSHTTAIRSTMNAQRSSRNHGSSRADLSALEKIALAVIAIALVVVALGPSTAKPAADYFEIRVEDGQSLWEIASTHRVPGTTTAQTVEIIAEKNGMDGFAVASGSTLLVPIVDSGNNIAMQ